MTVIDPNTATVGLSTARARVRWDTSTDGRETETLFDDRESSNTTRLRAFAYVNVDKTPLYRAIMGIFMHAKQAFGIHLRPAEVRDALAHRGFVLPEEEVEAPLKQLAEWGNLRTDPDTTDVSTVDEFYRERLLFQLTRAGETAEAAIAFFEKEVEQPGALQTSALSDIRELLGELENLASGDLSDPSKVFRTLKQLCERFEQLTDNAQTFIRSLQRAIDLHGADEDVLLAYKEKLVDYLERFVNKLLVSSVEIAEALRIVEASGIEPLLELTARHEIQDRLDLDAPLLQKTVSSWRGRWAGLRRWFVARQGERSQAEVLRAKTREAIPALLGAIAAHNDRRVSRTDRHADLRTLARWFAQAPSDADAHRLWRVAFGVTSARHLRVNDETLDAWDQQGVTPKRSWLEAPPVYIAPRLRTTGRSRRGGNPRNVIDRSAERAELARIAAETNRQIAEARRQLATGQRLLLSDLGELDPAPFELFLELLGETLSQMTGAGEAVETSSADGTIAIRLEPIAGAPDAVIETPAGHLSGPECWITLTDSHAHLAVIAEAIR